MKTFLSILALICISHWVSAQEFEMQEGDTTYVMKKYYLCFLIAGENRDQDSVTTSNIQIAHLKHLDSLAQTGKLHIAGPLEGDGELRGISILDANSEEEAYEMATSDPAVKAGRLKIEIHPWWAAKGSKLK